MDDPLADIIKAEPHDEDDEELGDLLIDDIDDEELVDQTNIEDPLDENDDNENQVRLEKLPRPVNELNCRQARTFLVKLLRASNGGNNPHYGNPESRPAFWPDYYWPWEALTDVHTKPRGMNEPLQYSEMMKLAIARGYQYFGYDPSSYVRTGADANADISEPIVSVHDEAYVEAPEFDKSKFYLKRPPRLPRPLSKVNCVQSRTALARLLRYQQCGNNPVYGSPDTEPPWWPNDLIRWVDMVDLRGKPPYLPDTKSYTEVLKIAIYNAYDYYGYDPEVFLDSNSDSNSGLVKDKQLMFPVIPASGIAPPPAPRIINSYQPYAAKPVDKVPLKLQNILPKVTLPPSTSTSSSIINNNPSSVSNGASAGGGFEEFDDDMDELPPKLPMPVGKMNCSVTRTCLAKLVRFHCGKGQLPNYGNPSSMPVWWPNHIIDWTKIKNLSHRYEGFLGNTYSNCLRIALIRGYAHYGLDANEYVESINNRESALSLQQIQSNAVYGTTTTTTSMNSNEYHAPALSANNNHHHHHHQPPVTEIQLPGTPVTQIIPIPIPKKSMPVLVPLSSLVSEGQYPQSLLDTRDWFPPRLSFSKAVDAPSEVIRSLKTCKVSVDRTRADKAFGYTIGVAKEEQRVGNMFDYFYQDLNKQKFTDFSLVATRKTPNRPKEKLSIRVHRFMLASHSPRMKQMLRDLNEEESCLVLSGVNGTILRLIVDALYTGKVVLDGIRQLRQFETALRSLHSFGILLNLRPNVFKFDDNESDLYTSQDLLLDTLAENNNGTDEDDADMESEVPLPPPDVIETKFEGEQAKEEKEELQPQSSPAPPAALGIEKQPVILRTSKRKRKEPSSIDEIGDNSPTKTKRSSRSSDLETPSSSSVVTTTMTTGSKKSKEEANKPNFNHVTIEKLTEKVKDGQIAFIKWLQKEGFLRKAPPDCLGKDCRARLILELDEADLDGVSWKCPSVKCHQPVQSIRQGSIFARQKKSSPSDSLSWIIQIILCWSNNTSLMKCQEMTGCQDVDKVFFWYDECRNYYGTSK